MISGNFGASINGWLRLKINQPTFGINSSLYAFPIASGAVTFDVPPNPIHTVYLVDIASGLTDPFIPTESWIIPSQYEGVTLDQIRGITEFSYTNLASKARDDKQMLSQQISAINSEKQLLIQQKQILVDQKDALAQQIVALGQQKAQLLLEQDRLLRQITALKSQANALKEQNQSLERTIEIMRSRHINPDASVEIARMIRP